MRLTVREKELLTIIKKEPLISQDELAQRFDISRSATAVHISNLIKKGIILGKGYVFNEQVAMVVVGENCLEIRVSSEGNRDTIDLYYGGMVQQICQVLSRLGVKVKLVTVVGHDETGKFITDNMCKNGVDITNVHRDPRRRTCRKIIVNGRIVYQEKFNTDEYERAFAARIGVAANCEWLIVEEQFQEMVINLLPAWQRERMPQFCTCRVINFPEELPTFLKRYNIVVIGLEKPDYLDYYSNRLVTSGEIDYMTSIAVITDGISRIVCIDESGVNDFPLPPNQSFNVRNNLPLFMTGLIYGLSMGYQMRQAVRIGAGTAVG